MWNKIKVRDLQKLIDISKRECTDDVQILDRNIELLSIIHGCTIEEIEEWHKSKFVDECANMYIDFNTTHTISQQPKIVVNDIMFYFRGGKNYNDTKQLANAANISDSNFSEKIVHALAFFYQPSRLSLSYNKYKSAVNRAELFNDANCLCVFGLANLIAASNPVLGKLVDKKITQAYNDFTEQVKQLPDLDTEAIKPQK
jgi:hypothetical protein